MAARCEITKKYAAAYAAAPKKGKSQILDQVVEVTGWNRDHARQQLRRRLTQPKGRTSATVAVIDRRRTKPRKYSYDALIVLQRVWAASGGSCGQYLAPAMTDWLDALETEGALIQGEDRYSAAVRSELEQMSAATIDRYLAPARAKDPIRGKTTTRPGTMLRNSISIRKAGDEVVVDELGAVVAVDAGHGERNVLDERVERGQDMDRGVVADRAGEHPAGVDVGEVHGAGELALQGGAAVGDGVGGPADGFLRRGEEVQPVTDQCP